MKNILSRIVILFALLTPIALSAQSARPPINGNTTIPSNGATARVQLTDMAVANCSFVADSANVGLIFFGGATVTNASGVNKGIPLAAGVGIFNVSMTNLKAAFFSTATNNNIVQWTCN